MINVFLQNFVCAATRQLPATTEEKVALGYVEQHRSSISFKDWARIAEGSTFAKANEKDAEISKSFNLGGSTADIVTLYEDPTTKTWWVMLVQENKDEVSTATWSFPGGLTRDAQPLSHGLTELLEETGGAFSLPKDDDLLHMKSFYLKHTRGTPNATYCGVMALNPETVSQWWPQIQENLSEARKNYASYLDARGRYSKDPKGFWPYDNDEKGAAVFVSLPELLEKCSSYTPWTPGVPDFFPVEITTLDPATGSQLRQTLNMRRTGVYPMFDNTLDKDLEKIYTPRAELSAFLIGLCKKQ